jgi:hypothetical protein
VSFHLPLKSVTVSLSRRVTCFDDPQPASKTAADTTINALFIFPPDY